MLSKEEVLAEIYRQELLFDTMSEHMQKSLMVSIRMKSIYDPLPEAVQKAYAALIKNIQTFKDANTP